MTSHLHLRIIDSPLVDNKSPRLAMVERMAKELAACDGSVDTQASSKFVLREAGFKMADIIMCIDDARQAAMQDIVAREMMKP